VQVALSEPAQAGVEAGIRALRGQRLGQHGGGLAMGVRQRGVKVAAAVDLAAVVRDDGAPQALICAADGASPALGDRDAQGFVVAPSPEMWKVVSGSKSRRSV